MLLISQEIASLQILRPKTQGVLAESEGDAVKGDVSPFTASSEQSRHAEAAGHLAHFAFHGFAGLAQSFVHCGQN